MSSDVLNVAYDKDVAQSPFVHFINSSTGDCTADKEIKSNRELAKACGTELMK